MASQVPRAAQQKRHRGTVLRKTCGPQATHGASAEDVPVILL
jgi:hypothetical protein